MNYKNLDKTHVKLFPNFTRHHLITYTYVTPLCSATVVCRITCMITFHHWSHLLLVIYTLYSVFLSLAFLTCSHATLILCCQLFLNALQGRRWIVQMKKIASFTGYTLYFPYIPFSRYNSGLSLRGLCHYGYCCFGSILCWGHYR